MTHISFNMTKMFTVGIMMSSMMLGLGAEYAQAIIDNNYPNTKTAMATICRATTSSSFAQPTYSLAGWVKNLDRNKLLEVVCPLTRDNTITTSGLTYVRVYVHDRHRTKGVSCDVWARDLRGGFLEVSERKTSVSHSGNSDIAFSKPVSSKFDNTNYIVRCEIPEVDPVHGSSSIKSIYWTEGSRYQ